VAEPLLLISADPLGQKMPAFALFASAGAAAQESGIRRQQEHVIIAGIDAIEAL